ncbi:MULTISPECIES: NAD-dependent deacylase [unclassified Sphingobacterium]|uniref:SIR2 family NAD-dependent protein deacylase n=1 Tax=unclassified Sphingobacterium TaxID=2609468 RepID=UPI0020C201A7|nr:MULTISPECIES: NAD-dependent deacylase [unclassified Sphingobacterium]
MKKIVVFTGAGISVESGLPTFRGSDGLWEGHRVEDVATPEAWEKDPELVQNFYNKRRSDCLAAEPNHAHRKLAELEKDYDITIITQNIDDLHERAGSSKVLHLHGQIRKGQSSINPNLIYDINGTDIKDGDLCELGSQLRPHVVWFGEAVPNMNEAYKIARQADVFITIGTSLQVYPAANLIYETKPDCKLILIDPNAEQYRVPPVVLKISEKASVGVDYLAKYLPK